MPPGPEPLVPPIALAGYIACVAGAAALANCSILAALLRHSRTGVSSIILQLALADLVLGASVSPELWSYNAKSWPFGNLSCVAYRGITVFACTASSYLVSAIALHSLATINVEEKAIKKRMKRNGQDEDDEIRSSRHSLVTSSDSSTPPRTMNLDYRVTSTKVSVVQPSLFVWVLALSLTVPEFVLATVREHDGVAACTIVDTSQRLQMYSILALINLILPIVMMVIAGVLVLIKINVSKILTRSECYDSLAALKLSLSLILLHVLLCTPRSAVTAYNVYTKSIVGGDTSLCENVDMFTINLVGSSTFLLATLLRPLLSIILLPRVRKMFSFGTYVESENV